MGKPWRRSIHHLHNQRIAVAVDIQQSFRVVHFLVDERTALVQRSGVRHGWNLTDHTKGPTYIVQVVAVAQPLPCLVYGCIGSCMYAGNMHLFDSTVVLLLCIPPY